ncbi:MULTISPECIES: bifunctional DNA primase/polymerase [unclassified Microcoleus]|uniref:bifunctional DNA primase/polymerase n=1 Tax=unclassified Microcoleus TaxID=2642155 RepID=UPI0025F57CA0|nr:MULTISPECIES: bifunctional DNA primase/polymerase [unclassified Microcoleus]
MLMWYGFVERFSNTLLALGAFGKRSFAVVSSRIYSHESDERALFLVPETSWHRLRNLKILTGEIDSDGKEECLEFRWLGTQSVLPPSIHPQTGKPYYWVRSPLEVSTVQAPEWLLALCENWRPEYQGEDELDLVRFPARLYQHFRRPLAIWLLARRFDNSRQKHGGQNKGSGAGSFTLLAASRILDRSKGHIRKMLCDAVRAGLLRRYHQCGDWITCYYTSFEKIVTIAGLEDLGPIATISIDALSNLNILATEIEAQHLQPTFRTPNWHIGGLRGEK